MNSESTKSLTSVKDEAEPKAGNGPVSIWFVGIFAVLVYLGMIYLDAHGGGFDPQVYRPYMNLTELKAVQPKTSGDDGSGRIVFNTYCAACHQGNGMGLPGQFPPLAGSEWVNVDSPNRVVRIVLYGFKGQVQVKGQDFNNNMPPWKSILKPEQIAAVLTYVRGNKEWGNHAPAVKPEKVQEIMGTLKTRDDNAQFTSEELMQVPLN